MHAFTQFGRGCVLIRTCIARSSEESGPRPKCIKVLGQAVELRKPKPVCGVKQGIRTRSHQHFWLFATRKRKIPVGWSGVRCVLTIKGLRWGVFFFSDVLVPSRVLKTIENWSANRGNRSYWYDPVEKWLVFHPPDQNLKIPLRLTAPVHRLTSLFFHQRKIGPVLVLRTLVPSSVVTCEYLFPKNIGLALSFFICHCINVMAKL
jgi:hypothetical protein